MLPKGLLKEYSTAISLIVRLADMVILACAAWLAYIIRFGTLTITHEYVLLIILSLCIVPIIFSFFNIYTSMRGEHLLRHSFRLGQAFITTLLILTGIAFFTKSGELFSRIWFFIWMSLSFFMTCSARMLVLFFLRFMRKNGWNERRVVIIGSGEMAGKLLHVVSQALWTGFKIIAILDDEDQLNNKLQISGIDIELLPNNLVDFLKEQRIDELWIAWPLAKEARVKTILYQIRHHMITIRFALDIFGLNLLNHSITDVAGIPVLNIRTTPMVGMNRFVKALEDRVLAGIILILISPVLAIISCLVKLSSEGPIFFKQKRLGWDGRIIKVYKFRTMVVHSERDGVLTQATMNDRRVTALGRFLRKTSLDELPQFFNVLQGRMSIVGPRPHALAHNELYKTKIDDYMHRHHVKPGITGWAQVNGWRGETDTLEKMQKRIEYDLYYISHWSIGFDLKIILITLFKGFVGRSVY